jgi:murein DD-endopeptidase MepM/ murein hydrolase activator NlpD
MTEVLKDFFKENPNATIDLETISDKALIKEIQELLNDKGFNAGDIDGIVGRNTLNALEKAKEALYLQYPTLIGNLTFKRLLAHQSKENLLFLPTNGKGVITSNFNPNRKHPVTGRIRPHRGIDIGAARGTPVYAVADGLVSLSVNFCKEGNQSCGGGFGNYIRVSHPRLPFSESVYAHLQTSLVSQGQFVEKGQQIGTLGNTGSSTGPHLHFETWTRNIAIDPRVYLNPIV